MPDTALVSELAGKPPARAPGFRANAAQRKAIEECAVEAAAFSLMAGGWAVENVGGNNPYDLHATRGGEELHVEVKGTVTSGSQVILTQGEVEHHAVAAPASALYLVTGIKLEGNPKSPTASGGDLRIIDPWAVEPDALTPIAYRYVVPPPPAD